MGKKTKKLFKSKERKSRADASAFLHQLTDKISQGQVVFRQGQEEIALQFSSSLTLKVKAKDKKKKKRGTRHSLEVKIQWFDNDDQGGSLELS